MSSSKLRKISKIVKEISMQSSQSTYDISGLDLSLCKFYYRTPQKLFKDLPSGDYTINKSSNQQSLVIQNNAIISSGEAIQVCYEMDLSSSKYEVDFEVDINRLTTSYNELVEDVHTLWEYIRKTGMIADDTTIDLILPQLNNNEVWVKSEDGYKGVSLTDAEGAIKKVIEEYTKLMEERLKKYTEEVELPKIKDEGNTQVDLVTKEGDKQVERLGDILDEVPYQQYTTILQPNENTITLPENWIITSKIDLFVNGLMLTKDVNYSISDRVITLNDTYEYEADILIRDSLPPQFFDEWKDDLEYIFEDSIDIAKDKFEKEIEPIADTIKDEKIEEIKNEGDKQLGLLAGAGSNFKPKQVANIELLKKIDAKEEEVYEVLGYYAYNDGATHKRVISSTDDGSGILLDNGKFANIIHDGKINVLWFGVKKDGTTDTTENIKKIFSSNIASEVFFPQGEYLISSTIIISKFLESYTLKSIKGNKAKIKVSSTFIGDYCFVFDNSETISPQMLHISGLSFEGNKSQKGLLFNYVQLFYLENCTLKNFIVGVEIQKVYYGTLGKNLNIIECTCAIYFSGNSNNSLLLNNIRLTTGSLGILIGSQLGGVSIQNCIIESFEYGIIGTVKRIEGGGLSSFINIVSNYFENVTKEIYLSRIDVSDDFTSISETNEGGYTLPDCVIKNNYFLAVKSKGNCISISPTNKAVIDSNFGLKKCELLLLRDSMPIYNHTIYCDDEQVEFVTIGKNLIVTGITIYFPNQIVYSGRLHYNKLVRVPRNNHTDYLMDSIIAPTGKVIKITNKELLEPLYEAFSPNELSSSYKKECKVYLNGNYYDVINKGDGNYIYKNRTEIAVGNISKFLQIGVTGEELLFYDVYSKMLISYKDGTYKGTIYSYIDSKDKAYGTELPASPKVNQIFYDINTNKYKIYNGSSWVEV